MYNKVNIIKNNTTIKNPEKNKNSTNIWITGIHAVQAALDNPEREKSILYITKEAKKKIDIGKNQLPIKYLSRQEINNLLNNLSNHQGVALKVYPLKHPSLEEYLSLENKKNPIVIILDQLTDSHNIGAIIRTAKAFSVSAIICTENNSPKENSTIAKSAAGALEKIKLIYVKNLVRTLKKLKEFGYWSIGMDLEGEVSLYELSTSKNYNFSDISIALILGGENKGIRPLVKKNCDMTIKIDISNDIDSLNVSSSLAIALYEIRKNYYFLKKN